MVSGPASRPASQGCLRSPMTRSPGARFEGSLALGRWATGGQEDDDIEVSSIATTTKTNGWDERAAQTGTTTSLDCVS